MTCPYCGAAASLLQVISSVSVVDYFDCQTCHKISEKPKGVSGEPEPLLMLSSNHRPAANQRLTT
jgi:hypothetical protein